MTYSLNGATDPAEPREVGLRFASDDEDGIYRRKRGRGFQYVDADGAAITDDAVLDSWLFANGTKPDSVWVAGRKLVEGGRHHRRDEISARFRSVMHQLLL